MKLQADMRRRLVSAIEQLPEAPTPADIERLLAPLAAGRDLGLLSEAGCPAVADPGALLVRRAHELGIRVRPLVGPSSLLGPVIVIV